MSLHEGNTGRCVVAVLEGLERAHSLSHILGDLCEALENRGSVYSLSLNHGEMHSYRCSRAGTVNVPEITTLFSSCWWAGHNGLYYFREGSFLIGTLAKPRLQGAELRLQQHFRWVQLRWDIEPLNGMLGRHLRRKLLHKVSPAHLMSCREDHQNSHSALNLVEIVWYSGSQLVLQWDSQFPMVMMLQLKFLRIWTKLIYFINLLFIYSEEIYNAFLHICKCNGRMCAVSTV